ncbi:hypothetical protein GCM10007906_20150 [Vibrio hyugaensis]|uniref:HTH arsR-type domain-containing protein n=1 Tax=Vibrio hyugaensis TaxID=1534743 RepID=A0ABQ5Y478_9VIBR|nr:ArsR family transcriptional regulator [Vibrio hyugaensis]GLR04427.1 hypothetical protein GCM10007906_20150 [Vibrio hyugaensis]
MKVSNPLTIIAIFAGVAETLATVALIKLPLEIQSIFVYFVMAFPAAIVLLFFFVLYFKNTALYAPSDFENQNHYLEANQIKESVGTQLDKIFADLNKSGKTLSKADLEKAKSTVNESVDIISRLNAKELEIYNILSKAPKKISDISNDLGMSMMTTTRYLAKMRDKGAIRITDDGVLAESAV